MFFCLHMSNHEQYIRNKNLLKSVDCRLIFFGCVKTLFFFSVVSGFTQKAFVDLIGHSR